MLPAFMLRRERRRIMRRPEGICQTVGGYYPEMYSPRHAAVNFLSELCRGESSKTDFFGTVVHCAVEVLNERPNTGFREQRSLESRWSVIFGRTTQRCVETREGYKESLEDMLVAHVQPSFQCRMVIFARKRVGLPHNLQILNSTTRKTL